MTRCPRHTRLERYGIVRALINSFRSGDRVHSEREAVPGNRTAKQCEVGNAVAPYDFPVTAMPRLRVFTTVGFRAPQSDPSYWH